jgi:hypothetical protein
MIFFDYLIKATEKLPKWLKEKSLWYNFALLTGDLLNNVNIYKDQLTRGLNLNLPEPNRPCLEAFLNDLYDPIGRNIKGQGYLDEDDDPNLEAAYVNIFIPPTELSNPNLPTDIQYISKLVGKLLPLPIGTFTSINIVTAYVLAFSDGYNIYAIAIPNYSLAFTRKIE